MKKFFNIIHMYLKTTDKILLFFCVLISLISSLMIFSIYKVGFLNSPKLAMVQAVAFIIGIITSVIISTIDYHTLAGMWKIYVPICVILVFLTFTPLGIIREGSDNRAWLNLSFTTLQPSELLKLAFIYTFSLHLSKVKDNINDFKVLGLLFLHGLIPIGLIIAQGDTGSAMIFMGIFLALLFTAGLSWKYIVAGISVVVVSAPLVWFFLLKDYQKNRILVIFDPTRDPNGVGFQQSQGLVALGSGEIFGKGLFAKNLYNVPEIYNDFIFAHIGQTLGFIGCLAVIFILCIICIKILFVGKMSKDSLGTFICVGVFTILFLQTIVNIGMVLGFMPVIGVTLPFLSAGGTSVVVMYISIGMVLSVYRYNRKKMLFEH